MSEQVAVDEVVWLEARYNDEDGLPYTPSPLPVVTVTQRIGNGSVIAVELLDDGATVAAGTGSIWYKLGNAGETAELAALDVAYDTTDAALVALGYGFTHRSIPVEVAIGTPAELVAQLDAIEAKTNLIGVGTTLVQATVDSEGNVIIYRGKTQTLRWHSDSTLPLDTAGAVRFQFSTISATCTVTGTAGDWDIEIIYVCPTTLFAADYAGELAYYVSTVEHEALLALTVTVKRNPGLEGE